MLAIDFGTSRTKVAYYNTQKGKAELIAMGAGDRIPFPSLFYVSSSGEILVGNEAHDQLDSEPSGVLRCVKGELRKTAIRANGHTLRPVALLSQLLATIRNRVSTEVPELRGQPLTSVVLTLPAADTGAGPVVEKVMRAAAAEAGFTDVHLISEPEAAAITWQREVAGGLDDVVVILDAGGGTVDWACLRRVDGVLRLYPECPAGGDDKVGGEKIDDELFEILSQKVEASGTDNALAAVRKQANKWYSHIRTMRERFNRTGTVLSIDTVRIDSTEILLASDELRSTVQDSFIDQVCLGFGRYLDTVREKSGTQTPHVLLVGGTGQIAGLKQALAERCRCKPEWWQLSEFATVLGAAWWGAERDGLLRKPSSTTTAQSAYAHPPTPQQTTEPTQVSSEQPPPEKTARAKKQKRKSVLPVDPLMSAQSGSSADGVLDVGDNAELELFLASEEAAPSTRKARTPKPKEAEEEGSGCGCGTLLLLAAAGWFATQLMN